MWIVPKNLKMSSAFVADTLASSEDLSLQELQLERSLMWRSKPSPLPTWLRRWNRTPWLQHLSGRILKPSQHTCFEIELTSLLAVIPANRSAQRESALEKMTPAISGLGSENISKQSDLFGASLKTSKDISVSDSEKSSKTWKDLVTRRRGEYSARLKSARLTRESESTSWAAPRTTDAQGGGRPLNEKAQRITLSDPTKTYGGNLSDQVRHWPTPSARDHKGGYIGGRIRNGKVSFDTLDVAVQHISNKDKKSGTLNPNWVEWLMGVPTGWTDLGSWGTE